MFFRFLDYYYRTRPILLGKIFKLLFANKRLVIGKNFQCDSIPKILINGKAVLEIGDNVIFRRNVELRAHHDSKIEIGNNCRIDRGVRLLSTNKANLVLKDGVRIGLYSVFNGGDSILVGDKTLISGFVYLQTSMHNYHKTDSIQEQGYAHAPISLGKDNWVGTQAIIFPGVTLEDGCIVGSNSVVNKSFGANSIIAGTPAKLLKERN